MERVGDSRLRPSLGPWQRSHAAKRPGCSLLQSCHFTMPPLQAFSDRDTVHEGNHTSLPGPPQEAAALLAESTPAPNTAFLSFSGTITVRMESQPPPRSICGEREVGRHWRGEWVCAGVPVTSSHFSQAEHSCGHLLEVTALCSDIPGSVGCACRESGWSLCVWNILLCRGGDC